MKMVSVMMDLHLIIRGSILMLVLYERTNMKFCFFSFCKMTEKDDFSKKIDQEH